MASRSSGVRFLSTLSALSISKYTRFRTLSELCSMPASFSGWRSLMRLLLPGGIFNVLFINGVFILDMQVPASRCSQSTWSGTTVNQHGKCQTMTQTQLQVNASIPKHNLALSHFSIIMITKFYDLILKLKTCTMICWIKLNRLSFNSHELRVTNR